jgi:hypothetical protein
MATQIKSTIGKSTIPAKKVVEKKIEAISTIEEVSNPIINQDIEVKGLESIIERKIESNDDIKIQELNKENAELKTKLEKQENEFSSKFNQMQSQMDALLEIMKGKVPTNNSPKNIQEDEDIAVGCRLFAGLGMVNADGTQTIVFRCGEKKYIPYEDLKSFLKENSRNNKALFANGLLFFYDEENYSRFKIKKIVDLDEQHIVDILTTPDTNQMIGKINELTNNLRKESVLHTLKFMIADMLIRDASKLKNFTYDNRDALEKYIGVKFDTLISNANMYKFLKGEK